MTVSNLYSVGQRTDEPVVERCTELGIAYLPYFPLAMGKVGRESVVAAVADAGDLRHDRRAGVAAAALADHAADPRHQQGRPPRGEPRSHRPRSRPTTSRSSTARWPDRAGPDPRLRPDGQRSASSLAAVRSHVHVLARSRRPTFDGSAVPGRLDRGVHRSSSRRRTAIPARLLCSARSSVRRGSSRGATSSNASTEPMYSRSRATRRSSSNSDTSGSSPVTTGVPRRGKSRLPE